jgi:hypothetical protein
VFIFAISRSLPIPCAHPQAKSFQKAAKEVRSVMWWQTCRMQLLLLGGMLLLAAVIFCAVCFTHGNCIEDRKQAYAVYKLYSAATAPGSHSAPANGATTTTVN